MMCDASAARLRSLKAIYPDVAAVRSFEPMLNGTGLDAVVVATSLKLHFPLARAALLAGKHVWIEQPMAASAAHCEELNEIARQKGLVLMVGDTFLYSPAVRKIKETLDRGDLGKILSICALRLKPGPCQKDVNVAWDLASHDISIILHLLEEPPQSVNCWGTAHITPGIEDVTSMSLNFTNDRSAIIHSSWLDPRQVREMTIVGSKRTILYDAVDALEQVRIFDAPVEGALCGDTFAEDQCACHCVDIFSPHLKEEEPLQAECLHFLECIQESHHPLTRGARGLELVRILEASSASLKLGGGAVPFVRSESTFSAGPPAPVFAQTNLRPRCAPGDAASKAKYVFPSLNFPECSN
jgi:predicted dehydrogenase